MKLCWAAGCTGSWELELELFIYIFIYGYSSFFLRVPERLVALMKKLVSQQSAGPQDAALVWHALVPGLLVGHCHCNMRCEQKDIVAWGCRAGHQV